MPSPKSNKAPSFKGKSKKLTEFLLEYEACTKLAKLESAEKCEHLVRYCSKKPRKLIEGLEEFENKKWDELKKALLTLYGVSEKKSAGRVKDLEKIAKSYKSKKLTKEKHINKYVREFKAVGDKLVRKQKINQELYNQIFWNGIHKKAKQTIKSRILATQPDLDRSVPYTFNDVVKAARYMFSSDAFDKSDEDSDDSDTEDNSDTDSDSDTEDDSSDDSDSTDDSSTDSDSSDSDDSNYKSHKKKKKKKKSKKESRDKGKDKEKSKSKSSKGFKNGTNHDSDKEAYAKEMDSLIRKMHKLKVEDPEYAVAYARLVTKFSAASVIFPSPVTKSTKEESVKQSSPKNIHKCIYCGDPVCRINTCDKVVQDIQKGFIKKLENQRIVFADGKAIPYNTSGLRTSVLAEVNPGKTVAAWKVVAEVVTDDSDSEAIAFNNVAAAIQDRNKRLVFDGVEVPSRKDKAKEKMVIEKPSSSQNNEAGDISGSKEADKPQYKLASKVQKNFDADKFAQNLLDQNVSIKMRDLVPALSNAVQKSLIDNLKVQRVPYEQAKTYANFQGPIYYHLPLGRIKGLINGITVEILLDRGSEINTMTSKAFEKCKVAINKGRRTRMYDINGGHTETLGTCEKVEIEIGNISTWAHVNVGGVGDFDVLLGQPWFFHAKTKWEDRDDGSWLTIKDPLNSNRSVEVLTSPIPSSASCHMARIAEIDSKPLNLDSKAYNSTIKEPGMSKQKTMDILQAHDVLKQIGTLGENNVFVYKPAAKKVKPVPATLPESARTQRRIPEDPLLSL